MLYPQSPSAVEAALTGCWPDRYFVVARCFRVMKISARIAFRLQNLNASRSGGMSLGFDGRDVMALIEGLLIDPRDQGNVSKSSLSPPGAINR